MVACLMWQKMRASVSIISCPSNTSIILLWRPYLIWQGHHDLENLKWNWQLPKSYWLATEHTFFDMVGPPQICMFCHLFQKTNALFKRQSDHSYRYSCRHFQKCCVQAYQFIFDFVYVFLLLWNWKVMISQPTKKTYNMAISRSTFSKEW